MFLVTRFLGSCCSCPDASGYNRKLEWTGISVATSVYTHDSTGTRISAVETLDFSNSLMAIRLRIEGRLLAGNCLRPHDWFGTSAYACKCDEITYAPVSPVTSLTVATIFRFDSAHPAGSPVTAYFRSPGYDGGRAVLLPVALPNYSGVIMKDLDVTLFLAARPEAPGPQQFAVEVKLANGLVFRDSTAVIGF